MATAFVLNRPHRVSRWQGHATGWLLAACLMLASAPTRGDDTPPGPELSPLAAQYRQLNLVLMVSEGVEPGFLAALDSQPSGDTPVESTGGTFPQVEVDDFQTPLNRIVDQRALMHKAAQVFRYAKENRAGIGTAIEAMAQSDPAEVAQVDVIKLAEDAIIIRTALTGSFEYLLSNGVWTTAAGGGGAGNDMISGFLETYRNRTLFLRNVMEYWQFEQELAAITDQAMDEAGGRMEAYQRMLEDEPNLDSFRQHLQAVEYIYWQTRGGKGKPPELPGDELIEAESRVN